MLFSFILYVLAAVLLFLSFVQDRQKTKAALKKAWKAFENILPQFLVILLIIGILTASANGSVTLIPGFVAFPLAAALLKSGAGLPQIAAFVSTLMMVGIVTLPAEFKVLGKKAALLRNGLALAFSFIVAMVMGVVL